MTDKRIVCDCPFCHTPPNCIQIKTMGNLNILTCPKCGVEFRDTNKMNLISKWNCR